MKPCPSCGKANDDQAEACTFCSIIFKKWAERPESVKSANNYSANQVFLPTSLIRTIIIIVLLALPAWFGFVMIKGCAKRVEKTSASPGFVLSFIEKKNGSGVKMAVENGAIRDSVGNGLEYLTAAIGNDQFEIVMTLLDGGANVSGTIYGDQSVWTALTGLKDRNKVNKYVAEILKRKPDLSTRHTNNVTPLILFAQNNLDLKPLIASGANVNEVENEGKTALFFVKNVDDAKALIDAGADINLKAAGDETPLMRQAWAGGSFDVMKLLVERGADINARTPYGFSPLHNAQSSGETEKANYLIQQGAR